MKKRNSKKQKIKHGLILVSFALVFMAVSACQNHQHNRQKKQMRKAFKIPDELRGEWVIKGWLSDSLQVFQNKKTYVQDMFPYYNYLRFADSGKLVLGTEGQFGCGTAMVENLNVDSLHYRIANNMINFTGFYTDHFGKHKMNDWFAFWRNGNQLLITKPN